MQADDPETWVDQHRDVLYSYALSRIKEPTIAEDLVQETLLAALKEQKGFEGRSSLRRAPGEDRIARPAFSRRPVADQRGLEAEVGSGHCTT
jgi:hypothetical protein